VILIGDNVVADIGAKKQLFGRPYPSDVQIDRDKRRFLYRDFIFSAGVTRK
jgi:hypothetical protein